MIVKIDLQWSTPDIHVFNVQRFIRKKTFDIINVKLVFRSVVPKVYISVTTSLTKTLKEWNNVSEKWDGYDIFTEHHSPIYTAGEMSFYSL